MSGQPTMIVTAPPTRTACAPASRHLWRTGTRARARWDYVAGYRRRALLTEGRNTHEPLD